MRPTTIPTTIPSDKSDSKLQTEMKKLYNSLIEYREPKTGRSLINVFMSLPSRKDFPDYYKAIDKPIAMNKIRDRIEKSIYQDLEAMMSDLKLMFSNCKFYNEDESIIHKDAITLEDHLMTLHADLEEQNRPPSPVRQETPIKRQPSPKPNESIRSVSTPKTALSKINIPLETLASTPVEKCSLNPRRRNSEGPKRQLLTGYIIYASEIRKKVIDKHPDQNFGDISRLVGNEWKALPLEIRSKYDQRALIHNRKIREKTRESLSTIDTSTSKMTKRNLARLAKEKMRQHHLSYTGPTEDSSISNTPVQNLSVKQIQAQPNQIKRVKNSSTQTLTIRFIDPPPKKLICYSDTFRRYIETLNVPNNDYLAEETIPDRHINLPTHWLEAGIGRHKSAEAALWALRNFMLQDAKAMRKTLEPYL